MMIIKAYSIEETLFEGEGKEVIAATPQGEIAILAGHLPLVTPIIGPRVKILGEDGEIHVFPISSGILEVRPESEVVILAGS
jgi:F-type H+-transporting ATPase subunit epsilon